MIQQDIPGRVVLSGISHCVFHQNSTDFLEEYIAFTFRVEEQAKKENIMKQAACTQKTELVIPTSVTTSVPTGYFSISSISINCLRRTLYQG
jgi:hypothetical protein